MFIRRFSNRRKDGSLSFGFSLLEGYRVGQRVKQRCLLNLGKDFAVEEKDWPVLTREVLNRLRGTPSLEWEALERGLQDTIVDIARRLRDNGYVPDRKPAGYMQVEDDFEHDDVRTVGGERIALQALHELGFMELLRTLGLRERTVRVACALVVGRMLRPASERDTHQWMLTYSSILELLQLEKPPPSLSTLYRTSDRVWQHREALMDGLFANAQQQLGFSESVVFYDLTNAYYCGRKQGELLRSKQKRSDCPLVTLALTLDASGFPRSADLLPGNVSEPGTLQAAVEKLKGTHPSVIMDAGIATAANLAWLREKGYAWICVQRSKAPAAPEREPDRKLKTKNGVDARVWKLEEEDKEARLYVKSAARKTVTDRILEKKRQGFEAELVRLNANLTKRGCTKRYAAVLRSIGRYQERYKQVASQYEVRVKKEKGGPNVSAVTFTHKPRYDAANQAAGGYILRTSHTDWPLERIVRTYWQLTDIEATFRTLKTDLGLRPIYHRKDQRIEGHLFLSVVAYHAVQLIRTKLKKYKVNDNWGTLQQELQHWQRVVTTLREKTGHRIVNKQDRKLTDRQHNLATILGLDPGCHRDRTRLEPAASPNDYTPYKAA